VVVKYSLNSVKHYISNHGLQCAFW